MDWKVVIYSALGILLTGLVGLLDYITGYQLSFSIFYLIPIALVTWLVGRWPGFFMSILGMFSWALVDRLSGHEYDAAVILYWNAGVRFGFFVIVVFSLSRIRQALDREYLLSRMDPLTGISNRVGFTERLDLELERARRYSRPLSLSYIDLDNFKSVNDKFGHPEGDRLLAAVGGTIRGDIRSTDLGARMGGDEFALLLPETGEEESMEAMQRLRSKLEDAMSRGGWPVTFSVGLVTYLSAPSSPQDAIKEADNLMYAVKTSNKGELRRVTIGEGGPGPETAA